MVECTQKSKTASFIIFIAACAGFSVVLIMVASAQLGNGMPLVATTALTCSVMTLVCCYDPEELESMTTGGGGGGSSSIGGMVDEDEELRQAAKDNGAVLTGMLISFGFGINVLLWRYMQVYTTLIFSLTVIGNTLLVGAVISIVWLFCFAPRAWSGQSGDMEILW